MSESDGLTPCTPEEALRDITRFLMLFPHGGDPNRYFALVKDQPQWAIRSSIKFFLSKANNYSAPPDPQAFCDQTSKSTELLRDNLRGLPRMEPWRRPPPPDVELTPEERKRRREAVLRAKNLTWSTEGVKSFEHKADPKYIRFRKIAKEARDRYDKQGYFSRKSWS